MNQSNDELRGIIISGQDPETQPRRHLETWLIINLWELELSANALWIDNWKSWYPLLKWDTRYDMIFWALTIEAGTVYWRHQCIFDSEFKLNRAFGKLKLTVQSFDQRIYGSKNQSGTASSQCMIIIISQMKDTQKIIVSWEIMCSVGVAFIKMIWIFAQFNPSSLMIIHHCHFPERCGFSHVIYSL